MRCEQEPAAFKISKEVQFEERQGGYLFFPVSVIWKWQEGVFSFEPHLSEVVRPT